jgi:uncharacterized protein YkuJ
MKPSQLSAILRRLEVMMEDNGDVEIRRFEKEGVERCVVNTTAIRKVLNWKNTIQTKLINLMILI